MSWWWYVEAGCFLAAVVVFYRFVVPFLFPTVTGRKAFEMDGVDPEVAARAQLASRPSLFSATGDAHHSSLRARRRPAAESSGP